MTQATEEFFAGLDGRKGEPLLRKVSGTIRFDLARGTRTEHWLVAIDGGDLAVSRANAEADGIVHADGSLFDEIATGEANAMAALLRGALAIEGNLELVLLFQRLFPGPPGSSGRRPATAATERAS